MAIVLKITTKQPVSDMKEFCRLSDELIYIGRFADKKTSKVIPGTILRYNGKFYSNELQGVPGVSSYREKDMITTSVSLFETTYVPNECKPVKNCPILIEIWDIAIDDEAPIESYAFYSEQLAEVKNVVNSHKDVDIFFNNKKVNKEELFEK